MSKRVALLRAVNVGGTGTLPMARLRQIAAGAGFGMPQTLLQSGNLVFEGGSAGDAVLEARLAQALETEAGLSTDIFVRDAAGWARLMAANPMPAEADAAPSAFLMLVLRAPAPPATLEKLHRLCADGERLEARGDALYALFPGGMGRSRLAAAMGTKAAGLVGTGRNWNTVRKLAALLAG